MMIEGYIAREKDGMFMFFFQKPNRGLGIWTSKGQWIAMLPEDVPEAAKDLTYENDPLEYRLYLDVRSYEKS